jgi:hypothetical protein
MTQSENNGTHNGKDDRGRFVPGNPGKPPGSSKNKLRDKIRLFIDNHWEQLPQWFESLKPKEKLDVMASLLPYAIPRLQSINTTDGDGQDLAPPSTAFIDYKKLSPETIKEILMHTHVKAH